MFGVIAEDKSDAEMLVVLVKRMAGNDRMTISRKGYVGCGDMLNKGAKQIIAMSELGCSHFIICYDSDGENATDRYNEVIAKVIKPAEVNGIFCALVPVQEIESWILADLHSVNKVITSYRPPAKEYPSPENIKNSKEFLENLTRDEGSKPKYTHAIHNQVVARHLDLAKVREKCPSFLPLYNMVTFGRGNAPVATLAPPR